MGFGVTFVKYVLFFFNLIVALAGLALIGVGVAVKLNVAAITSLIHSKYEIAPTLTIVVGCIVFVIAFYGCCGAIRESNCMLVLYAIFLIVLIIVQVVLAILVLMYLPQVEEAVKQLLDEAFADTSNETTLAFHNMQSALKCCGTTGPLSYPLNQQVSLPQSCCENTILGACTTANAYSRGCVEVVTNLISGSGGTLGGLAIGIAAVEIVGVIFSLCLANHARNMERRW